MQKLQLVKAILTVNISVSNDVLEQRLVASPQVLGQELSRQIHAYVIDHKLGYYPALEYFHDNPSIDPDLLEGIQSMVWFVTELLYSELRIRLRSVFSHVEIDEIQSRAYTMPNTRPSHLNAFHELSLHYTPDQVKVTLVLSNVEKIDHRKEEDLMEEIKDSVRECLVPSFDDVTITSIQISQHAL